MLTGGAHASPRTTNGGSDLTRLSSQEAAVHALPPAAGAQARAAADPARLVMDSFAEMKAEETVLIDLAEKTSIADSMIIATGRSNRHVAAIAEKAIEDLKAHGFKDLRVEGLQHGDWVLIDAGDVVAHVFRPEVRAFYNLEKLWGADRPGERRAV